MPRIPEFTPRTGESMTAGLVDPAAVGAPFKELSRVFEEIAEEHKRRSNSIAYTKAQTGFQQELFDLSQAALEDDDPATVTERFSSDSQALIERYSQGLEDPVQREDFISRASGLMLTRSSGVMSEAGKNLSKIERDEISLLSITAQRSAGSSNSLADIDMISENYFDRLDASDAYTDGEKALEKDKFLSGAETSFALRELQDNPAGLLERLKDPNNLSHIDQIQRIRMEGQAKLTVRNAKDTVDNGQDRASAAYVTNLSIRIKEGLGTVEALTEELALAWSSGVIKTGAKHESILTALVELGKKRIVQSEDIAYVESVIDETGRAGNPNDSEYYERIDRYYEDFIDEQATVVGGVEGDTIKLSYVDQTHMVPKALKGEVVGLLGGGTDQVVRGANLLDKISTFDNGKRMIESFSQDDIEMGLMVARNMKYGVPPGEAVADARKALEEDPKRTEKRRAAWTSLVKNGAVRRDLEDAIGEQPWLWGFFSDSPAPGTFLFGGDIEIPDAMHFEYEALRFDSYLRTGRDDISHKHALSRSARAWGVTEVTGPQRWQKHAPEVWYPEFGSFFGRGQTHALQEQLFGDLVAAGIITEGLAIDSDGNKFLPPGTQTWFDASQTYLLSNNADTGRRINPETGRNAPVYTVLTPDPESGEFRAVPGFERFYFDYSRTDAGKKEQAKRDKAKKESADDLRAEIVWQNQQKALADSVLEKQGIE